MITSLVEPAAAWLVPLVLVLLLAGQSWRGIRRRSALNRALHEIRRPLQALALSIPDRIATVADGSPAPMVPAGPARAPEIMSGTVWQAISALGRLDRELNGGHDLEEREELVACRLMSDACVRRWQPRARLAGSKLHLRWAGPDALIRGDGGALSAALENLIVNAIEHGGTEITVNALIATRHLRLEVLDSGRLLRDRSAGNGMGPRHGHGLKVAERVAADHGGRLDLDFGSRGSKATLVLPVNSSGASRSVPVRVNW